MNVGASVTYNTRAHHMPTGKKARTRSGQRGKSISKGSPEHGAAKSRAGRRTNAPRATKRSAAAYASVALDPGVANLDKIKHASVCAAARQPTTRRQRHDHERDVHEAAPRRDLRQVRDPQRVRPRHDDISLDQPARHRQRSITPDGRCSKGHNVDSDAPTARSKGETG